MSKRRKQGKLASLTREERVQRLAKRKRKKTWAARVWMRQHVQGQR